MTNAPQQFPGQQPQYNQGNGQQPPFYPGNAAPTPTKPKKPWFKRFWVWALIVLAIIVISSIASNSGNKNTSATAASATQSAVQQGQAPATAATEAQTSQATKAKDKLTLDDGWQLDTSNPYGATVNGYVTNNTDKAVTNYVQITFDALDSAGANLGTCLANTNTIDANGKWKFQATCTGTSSDVASVRLKEISGF